VLPGQPLTALLAFEHKVCADALVRANGMSLNGQTIFTRYLIGDSEGERNLDDRDDGEEETVVGRNAMLVSPGTGWDGVGATGQNRSFLARPPLPAADRSHLSPTVARPRLYHPDQALTLLTSIPCCVSTRRSRRPNPTPKI